MFSLYMLDGLTVMLIGFTYLYYFIYL